MKSIFLVSCFAVMVVFAGCTPQKTDSRVNIAENVKSDSLISNLITRPIIHAFSALIGEGIELQDVNVVRNDDGFQEIQIKGYNRSFNIRRFDYRVEWFDAGGMIVPSKTTVWQPMSVMPKSKFNIISIAPSRDVNDFTMNTRKSK